jgi:hypothetical protein
MERQKLEATLQTTGRKPRGTTAKKSGYFSDEDEQSD